MALKEHVLKAGGKLREKRSDKIYLSNADLTAAVSDWVRGGTDKPIPNQIGIYLMLLVNRYGTNKNYSGYSYLEEMKSEALLTCIKYMHNFNPEKSNNAFAYFSMIIDNAFKMYLKKEKTQHKIKYDQLDKVMHERNYQNIDLYQEDSD
jgi:DNA-directed RNA polymerase specialized sigma subunit